MTVNYLRFAMAGVVFFGAAMVISCGKDIASGRGQHDSPSILNDGSNVLDATGFAVASKGELDAVVVNSMALADLSLGRMFDFDDGAFTHFGKKLSLAPQKSVFCDGEMAVIDTARFESGKVKLTYEADVTACVTKPASAEASAEASADASSLALAADPLIIDRQTSAFSLTFECSSRDLSTLITDGKASTVMATTAAFSCPANGAGKSVTGRAYRFAGLVKGRYVGPRSEVPVEQRFWRGYDDGSSGAPCVISRGSRFGSNLESAGDLVGACRLFERSESTNLVDNSKKGRLLTATASARMKNGRLFDNGNLSIQMNGWSAATQFSTQDANINANFNGPGGACAAYTLRPAAVNFEAKACF